jgi:hypothetical protein
MRRLIIDGAKICCRVTICITNRISTDRTRTISVAGCTSLCTVISRSMAAALRFLHRICERCSSSSRQEGHDVMELREELAHLLRALMRARHGAVRLESRRQVR